MTNGHDDHIRKRAYEIWEQEGRPEGREREHWQQAQDENALPPVMEEEAPFAPADAIVDQDFTPPAPKPRAPRKRKGLEK
ncbi:DUF2934 domain-containing protein [Sphingobium bisphenolivorans]|uniref:DUF2934 domain-containing protein n=1 Tax=Sphingobium bisphenolivorans TaxID=1335760 RepID=UPI0003A19034|nr:DUF2934 domain-containing protein [Sphingobium bisphenolivorans]